MESLNLNSIIIPNSTNIRVLFNSNNKSIVDYSISLMKYREIHRRCNRKINSNCRKFENIFAWNIAN